MFVTIAKVHENVFQGEALSVTVPTTEGEITIMPKHEAFVATVKEGTIVVRTSEESKTFFAQSGVLEISNNQVTVLL